MQMIATEHTHSQPDVIEPIKENCRGQRGQPVTHAGLASSSQRVLMRTKVGPANSDLALLIVYTPHKEDINKWKSFYSWVPLMLIFVTRPGIKMDGTADGT